MPEAFDPYLQWLGIRDPQRPPNHYRLLGIDLFEGDATVVGNAADRQMAHVRTFQSGPHAEISQRLLNELAAARVCLLRPERKSAYDIELRKQIDVRKAAKPAPKPVAPKPAIVAAASMPVGTVAVVPAQMMAPSPAAADPFADFAADATSSRSRQSRKIAKKKSPVPIVVAVMLLALVAAIAALKFQASDQLAQNSNPPQTPKPTVEPRPGTGGKIEPKPIPPVIPPKAVSNDPGKSKPSDPETARPTVVDPPDAPDESLTRPDETTASETTGSDPAPENPTTSEPKDDPALPADLPEEPDIAPAQELPTTEPLPPTPVDKRLLIPEKSAQNASRTVIKDLFKSEYTARKPEERAALAKKLLSQANETTDDTTARFVMLGEARDLAAGAGDLATALQAVDRLAKDFQYDEIEERIVVMTTLSRTAKSPEIIKALSNQATKSLDNAIEQDRYDAAKRLLGLALAAAKKGKDLALTNQLQSLSRDLKYIAAEYEKAKHAMDTLKKDPSDPDANLAVGGFLCFAKGDFEKGLPLLAKGSDAELQQLSQKELSHPGDALAKTAIADDWWIFADRCDNDQTKAILMQHSATLYQQALPELRGLAKTQAEKKLQQFSNSNQLRTSAKQVNNLAGTSWDIIWPPNPAAKTGDSRQGTRYNPMRFNADGTCGNQFLKGNWELKSGIVIVTYPSRPTFFQRYWLEGTTLRSEHYDPPNSLEMVGSGTRITQ